MVSYHPRKNTLSLMATLSLTLAATPCSAFVPLQTSSGIHRHSQSHAARKCTNLALHRNHLNPLEPFSAVNRHCTVQTRAPLHTRSESKLQSTTTLRGNSLSEVLESLEQTLNPSKPATSTSSDTKSPKTEEELQSSEPEEDPIPPYAAQTLDGRLLCVSQCAYEISPPYFRACGYRPGTTAKRVTRGVNSALIGTNVDGITIAFRGTVTTSLLDWLQNAALFLSDVDEDKYKIKGKIHTGFYRGTKSLWKPIKSILKEMLQECEEKGWKKDVYFTGHSKGGAMASIAAILMKADKELPDPSYIW